MRKDKCDNDVHSTLSSLRLSEEKTFRWQGWIKMKSVTLSTKENSKVDNKNVISFVVSLYDKCIHIVHKLWPKGN